MQTLGDGVDKAWGLVDELFTHHPNSVTDNQKPLHVAVASFVNSVRCRLRIGGYTNRSVLPDPSSAYMFPQTDHNDLRHFRTIYRLHSEKAPPA